MNQYGEVTLTSQLSEAIANSTKKWTKDHVKAFFKPRLEQPMKDQAAIDVLIRVGKQDKFTCEKINGKTHVYTSMSKLATDRLNSFLYGFK